VIFGEELESSKEPTHCNNVTVSYPATKELASSTQMEPVPPSTLDNRCFEERAKKENAGQNHTLRCFSKPRGKITHIMKSEKRTAMFD
jgi:hypothetical protein